MSSLHQPQEIIKDKYRITGVLGKGGVAITYSAIDLETNSPVAIKVISLKQLDDWKQIELFTREAEVLKQLEHPAIPKYIDYFDRETDKDKLFYLVQEIAPGKSLHQLVDSGWRATEKEVKDIARQVLDILSYLHSLDPPVIHRDIKPNNLIRSDEGKIYLVDFGAVKNTYYNTLMQGSTVVGTYGYMSPEQFRGKALPATDLYSLGATLLYLLTHRSPAELPQDTLKLDFRNYLNIDDSFADWLEKILEPDFKDRFDNAEVALAKLDKSQQKKNKKLITSISAIVLSIGLLTGINSYKWFFLSRLGFYPVNICSDILVARDYLKQKGNVDIQLKSNKQLDTIYSSILNIDNDLLSCLSQDILSFDNSVYLNKINYHNAPIHRYLIKELFVKSRKIDIDFLSQDLNDEYKVYRDLLFFSMVNSNKKQIKTLIKKGADINITNTYFYPNNSSRTQTLLNTAIGIKREFAFLKTLIELEAKIDARNSMYYSNYHRFTDDPLYSAIWFYGHGVEAKDQIQLVDLLLKNRARIHGRINRLVQAMKGLDEERVNKILELIVKYGGNINEKNYNEQTPLYFATYTSNKILIKLLIKYGADVNAIDKNDQTPIFRAKNKKIAQILIDNGADLSIKDNSGNSIKYK